MKKAISLLMSFLVFASLAAASACAKTPPSSDSSSDSSGNLSGNSSVGTKKTLWDRYWEEDDAYGMTVSADGTLLLAGEPYYGFGMNYYSLFAYTYSASTPKYDVAAAKKGIDQIAEYDTQVVRINAGGYGASHSSDGAAYDWVQRYLTDTDAYMAAMREIVDYCETKHVGLILSLFWKVTSIPYHFGETCAALGDPASKSHKFFRDYTAAIVTAFKDSKAVMGWEIGNEWNLETDLDVLTSIEAFRVMKQEDYVVCARAFDEIVTSLDTHKRFRSSGNAVQRTSQYNQAQGEAKTDTWEEHLLAMEAFHPGNFTMVSDHVYDYPGQRDYKMTLSDYLTESVAGAKAMKKVYFLGEWCLSIAGNYPVWSPETQANTGDMMTLKWTMDHMEAACEVIMESRVQLTLFWNFDPQDLTEGSFCLENVKGTVAGADHTKFGKFLFSLCQKLNAESYPAVLGAKKA